MSNERIIKVSDVQISTASVEVHVIRIGGKQITQSVYNQIQSQSRERGEEIWGWVNQCPKDCIYSTLHVHYIWIYEGELRRGMVLEQQRMTLFMHITENTPQLFIAV